MLRTAVRSRALSLLAIGAVALTALVLAARPAHAQESTAYSEYQVGNATACHQQADLNSPRSGSVQAGEIVYGFGLVLGADAVVFLRTVRTSGEDIGYCPAYGPNFTNNIVGVVTRAPVVLRSNVVVTPSVAVPGFVGRTCDVFGRCFTPGFVDPLFCPFGACNPLFIDPRLPRPLVGPILVR